MCLSVVMQGEEEEEEEGERGVRALYLRYVTFYARARGCVGWVFALPRECECEGREGGGGVRESSSQFIRSVGG